MRAEARIPRTVHVPGELAAGRWRGPRGWLDQAFVRRLAVVGTGTALARALGLLFTVVVAALFVPADYGYIRWAMSVGMLAAIPATAGPVALARALGRAHGDPAHQAALARVGLAAIAGVTGLTALVTALGLGLLGRPVGGALAVLVGMTLFTTCFNIYRGVGSAWRMAALATGGNLLQLGVVLVLCGALGLTTPDLVLAVYAFAWLVVLLALEWRAGPHAVLWAPFAALRRWGVEPWLGPLGQETWVELWRVWGPLVLAQAAYTVWMWADVVLVEHFLGAAAAGQYGLARTGVTVFLLVPEAIVMLLLPRVAAEGPRALELTGRLLVLTAAVSLGLLGGILLLAPPLLQVFGGGRYAAATAALPGLAVGMALYALYMVLEGHLVGLGRAGAHAVGVTVMATITLAGATLLLPRLGLVGAGLAFAGGAAAGLATLGLLGRGVLAHRPGRLRARKLVMTGWGR
jgi:O-antigen/teichoic acid export membrane protein